MRPMALKVRPKMIFPLFAWIIMFSQGMNPFKKTAWSHNAILFEGVDGRFMVIDSTSKGVRILSDENFFSHYKIVGSVSLIAPLNNLHLLIWLQNIIGRDYDGGQIFGLALKILGIISFNKFGSNYKKMTCNEVVLNYLQVLNGFEIGDPDNYCLLETWRLVSSLES